MSRFIMHHIDLRHLFRQMSYLAALLLFAIQAQALWPAKISLAADRILIAASSSTPSGLEGLKGNNLAVAVFSQDPQWSRYEKMAQTRLEDILIDNAFTVLDEKKSKDFMGNWRNRLNDPGYVLTAEDFIEMSEKFEINSLTRVYFTSDVTRGLADYYTATAGAEIRFIDANAKVAVAKNSVSMGTRGNPPSDGLTRESAMRNAILRALDDACKKGGLDVLDTTQPRRVSLELEGPISVEAISTGEQKPELDTSLGNLADLLKAKWRKEEVSCTARAASGKTVAVAGYIKDTNFQRKPPRMYGSRIHLIDLEVNKQFNTLECHELGFRGKGTRKVLDCVFVGNWRYLAALSGRKIFLWDVERGRLMSEVDIPKPLKSATLDAVKGTQGSLLVISPHRGKPVGYRIVRKK